MRPREKGEMRPQEKALGVEKEKVCCLGKKEGEFSSHDRRRGKSLQGKEVNPQKRKEIFTEEGSIIYLCE